jgi:hypothetical protein
MKRGRFFFWLIAGPVAVLAAMLVAAHPYLAVTERSGGDVLVVEGWMAQEHLEHVPRWVDSLRYERVYTTGSIRPFAYYLKIGEAIEVRFAQAVQGRIAITVAGVPGAGFRITADDDTLMEQAVETGGSEFLSDREINAASLRIASTHSGSGDPGLDNIFIKQLRIGLDDAHLVQDTVLFIRRDGRGEPAWPTYAHQSAAALRKLGVRAEVIAVPSWGKPDSRSWANASYFGLRAKSDGLRSFDVMTVGVHGRRSRELFRRACGPNVQVGVISLEDPECPRNGWWRKRNGWLQMLKEIGGNAEPIAVDLTR